MKNLPVNGLQNLSNKNFLKTFNRILSPSGRLFLQDGDPRQFSRAAKNAVKDTSALARFKSNRKHVPLNT